jgi:hypothetical protein
MFGFGNVFEGMVQGPHLCRLLPPLPARISLDPGPTPQLASPSPKYRITYNIIGFYSIQTDSHSPSGCVGMSLSTVQTLYL